MVNMAVRKPPPLTFIKIIRGLLLIYLDFHRPKMGSMCSLSAAILLGAHIAKSAAML